MAGTDQETEKELKGEESIRGGMKQAAGKQGAQVRSPERAVRRAMEASSAQS